MEDWFNLKNNQNIQEYINFCKKNDFKIFYINDFPWSKYQNILQPAILPGPYESPKFTKIQIKKLLKKVNLNLLGGRIIYKTNQLNGGG